MLYDRDDDSREPTDMSPRIATALYLPSFLTHLTSTSLSLFFYPDWGGILSNNRSVFFFLCVFVCVHLILILCSFSLKPNSSVSAAENAERQTTLVMLYR